MKTNNKYNWSVLIKDLRSELLVSQEEFASIIDVAFCSINRYENGHFSPIFKTQRKIIDLARKYDFDFKKYKNE